MKQSMYFVFALSLLSACGITDNPYENCNIWGDCSKPCDSVWGCEKKEDCGIWGCDDDEAKDESKCDFYGNCKD